MNHLETLHGHGWLVIFGSGMSAVVRIRGREHPLLIDRIVTLLSEASGEPTPWHSHPCTGLVCWDDGGNGDDI